MSSTRAPWLVILLTLFVLLTAVPAVQAADDRTETPPCPEPMNVSEGDVTEQANTSIQLFGIGPNVSPSEIPDAESLDEVPRGGSAVVQLCGPNVTELAHASADPFDGLFFTLQGGDFLAGPTMGTTANGSSENTVYVVFREQRFRDGRRGGDQLVVRADGGRFYPELDPDSENHVDFATPTDEVALQPIRAGLDRSEGWNSTSRERYVERTDEVQIRGWSNLTAGETVTLELSRNSSTVVRRTIDSSGGDWQTAVDFSTFPNGTRLSYRLVGGGSLQDQGTLLVVETPLAVREIRVQSYDERTESLLLQVEPKSVGFTDGTLSVPYRFIDDETNETVRSGAVTVTPSNASAQTLHASVEGPDEPGSYVFVVDIGGETERRALTVPTEVTNDTANTTGVDPTLAPRTETGEQPGFGVFSTVVALLAVVFRYRS
ncbi:PGF-CTERM sorting domain-containing protein [Haloarchaeobius sp. DFWS5]|uniref:PGF-CTERM sorting domain-containing protein n=1 Tax=Haloarchaeobius sp. DFWS5 TaxID=3446114 RepID=UPI003EB82507